MIEYSALLDRTRAYIDEYVGKSDATDETVQDDFARETDALLEAHITAAARFVATIVPNNYLTVTKADIDCDEAEMRDDGRGVVYMELPGSFMKLNKISVRDSQGHIETKRAVRTLLPKEHPSYDEQWNPVAGIGAGSNAPKAYREGQDVEIHSVPYREGMTYTAVLEYFEIPKLDENKQYAVLGEPLLDVVALRAASLYLAMTGKETAQAAVGAAAELLATLTGMPDEAVASE